MVSMKKMRRFLLCVLIIVIAAAPMGVPAAETRRVVTVGFFPMRGYNEYDEAGNCVGMDVDYLKEVCRYTGWDLRFVNCDSWDDALERLENEEIDLVGSAQFTMERSAKFRYASLASGSTYGVLAVKGDSDLAYEDFSRMGDLTFGLVETYVRRLEFEQYLRKNGVTNIKMKLYDDTDSLAQALEDGEIDVFVHSFLEIRDGWRMVGRFAPTPFYYITYPGNEDLLEELDQAIADVKMESPDLENELFAKYYQSRMDQSVLLNSEEKSYIEQAGTLKAGYIKDQYPFSYESGGECMGLAKDALEDVAEKTGLKFKYVPIDDFTSVHHALATGEIDLFSYSGPQDGDLSEEGLTLTRSYAMMPRVLIMRKDQSSKNVKRVAMTSNTDDASGAYGDDDDVSVVYYNSYRACLDAVKNQEADAAVCDSYLAAYLLSTDASYGVLKVQNAISGDHAVHMLVHADGKSPLVSILNKELPTITDKDVNDYMLQDDFYSGMSIQRFIEQNSMAIIALVLIFVSIIVAIMGYLLYNSWHIRKLTYKDPELDVWNQSYFVYRAEKLLKRKGARHYAVAYTNINLFSRYNTLYGWNKGQRLLEICVEVFGKALGKHEFHARSHNAHFLIMSEYTDRAELEAHYRQILDMISEQIFAETGVHMVATMGVCYLPDDSHDLQEPLAYAIQAADNLKDIRKNDLQVYDDELLQNLKQRHEREKLLESVDITDKYFTVFYQAKVDIRTERVVGAEALIRFKDPTAGGMIRSPYFFVPYYEEVGRITEIDFFVLEGVCKMLKTRLQEGKRVVPISCNFSRMHFTDEKFPDKLKGVLDSYNIPSDLIEVEITETLVVDEMQAQTAKATVDELHDRGIKLSIDDFGSGYSSLGVFESIPASVIKLDRSFLTNNENHDRQVKIMSNIVNLASSLDAQIVCEGVETEEDIEVMHEIGANIAQGYLYAKPVSQWEFEQRLDAEDSAIDK